VAVRFVIQPDPPVSGDNQVEVVVTENGTPVTDATASRGGQEIGRTNLSVVAK
jgi:hypothetical protein